MEVINIDEIKVNSDYLRVGSEVDSLVKSIETIGLINPLTINGKNELLAGGRRYSACQKLGIKEVPVHRVDRSALEQELISIDENIIRKGLNKIELEKSLNRGREIHETLNPMANKIEIEMKPLTPSEKKEEKIKEERDEDSFAAVTAQKIGMSKSSIKQAIRRDELASEKIKLARGKGKINASQTNEIIRLDKQEQEEILPYVQDRSVKEVRKLVDMAKRDGLKQAIMASSQIESLPREYKAMQTLSKRLNKTLAQIILEEISYNGEEKQKMAKELKALVVNLKQVLKDHFDESITLDEVMTFQKPVTENQPSLS